MLPWIARARHSLTVRPARRSDSPAINQMLQSSLHSHLHLDWRPATNWIGHATAFVAESRYGLVGCLICPADPPPAAWVRAAAANDGGPPAGVMQPLFDACLPALAAQGIATLSAMPTEPWLPPILDELGFAIVERVESWGKVGLKSPRRGSPEVQVRPARRPDITHLAHIAQAAFAPRWQLGAETLALAWQQAATFSVAEQGKSKVGFQISLARGEQAHLVHLTVHPAAQGRGVGSRLLADALNRYATLGLTHVSLNTQSNNTASHRLYKAFGFQRVSSPLPVWERAV